MPKKRTSSDTIKDALRRATKFGGRNWKRRQIGKIPGTDTTVTRREFENAATGQGVEVLEISGHTRIVEEGGKLFVLTETQPKTPVERADFTTVTDDDPVNNEAADRAVQMILDTPKDRRMTDDEERRFDKLIDEAGQTAWNNKLCFAYETQYGDSIWRIAPIRYFEEHGHIPVGELYGFSKVLSNEGGGTFMALDEDTPPQEIADQLMAEGFVFHPDFQNFIDPEHNGLVPTGNASGPTTPEPGR